MTKKSKFPNEWDESRVRDVIDHYEAQTDLEAEAEDVASLDDDSHVTMIVPKELVSEITELIARRTKE